MQLEELVEHHLPSLGLQLQAQDAAQLLLYDPSVGLGAQLPGTRGLGGLEDLEQLLLAEPQDLIRDRAEHLLVKPVEPVPSDPVAHEGQPLLAGGRHKRGPRVLVAKVLQEVVDDVDLLSLQRRLRLGVLDPFA